jgi:hypothetical protein
MPPSPFRQARAHPSGVAPRELHLVKMRSTLPVSIMT